MNRTECWGLYMKRVFSNYNVEFEDNAARKPVSGMADMHRREVLVVERIREEDSSAQTEFSARREIFLVEDILRAHPHRVTNAI
jgi:hypothetical protein